MYDESVKDEVLKALTRSELDIEVQMEGKDIRVKMGLGKKEHEQAAKQTIKVFGEEAKRGIRNVRQSQQGTLKKLQKILPKDEVKQFEDDLDKEMKNAEKQILSQQEATTAKVSGS